MRHRIWLAATCAAVAVVITGALPVQAAPRPTARLTAAQAATIRHSLAGRGVGGAAIDDILSDYSRALQVPTSSGVETTDGVVTGVRGMAVVPALLGDCSGPMRWVARTQYENNIIGNHLAAITLRTNWCYNGSRVTYSYSSRSQYVYALGMATVSWQGWADFSEGWYSYNGRTGGGVMTSTQGQFGSCAFRVGCLGSVYPSITLYVHYDGTYTSTGSS